MAKADHNPWKSHCLRGFKITRNGELKIVHPSDDLRNEDEEEIVDFGVGFNHPSDDTRNEEIRVACDAGPPKGKFDFDVELDPPNYAWMESPGTMDSKERAPYRVINSDREGNSDSESTENSYPESEEDEEDSDSESTEDGIPEREEESKMKESGRRTMNIGRSSLQSRLDQAMAQLDRGAAEDDEASETDADSICSDDDYWDDTSEEGDTETDTAIYEWFSDLRHQYIQAAEDPSLSRPITDNRATQWLQPMEFFRGHQSIGIIQHVPTLRCPAPICGRKN